MKLLLYNMNAPDFRRYRRMNLLNVSILCICTVIERCEVFIFFVIELRSNNVILIEVTVNPREEYIFLELHTASAM